MTASGIQTPVVDRRGREPIRAPRFPNVRWWRLNDLPETRYTKSGEFNIAYQVVGEADLDLLYIPGFVSNVEIAWQEPLLARFFNRLARFSRLIMFDKRGVLVCDPQPAPAIPASSV